jgi:hypothetical protein
LRRTVTWRVSRVFTNAEVIRGTFVLRKGLAIEWMVAAAAKEYFRVVVNGLRQDETTHVSITYKITPALQQSAGIPT